MPNLPKVKETMQRDFLKFGKVLTNIAFSPLLLISNNSELTARYLPNTVEKLIISSEINYSKDGWIKGFNTKDEKNVFIAENDLNLSEEGVLISEIIIEGWENHPEGRKLELAAYDSMSIKPGSIVDNKILNRDLNAIYASGWFSGVKIESQDWP